jgi:type IV secretory pathway VirJ component
MTRPRLTRSCAALLALLCLGSARAAAAQKGDLRVLRREGDGGVMMGYTDAANALYRTMQGELVRDLDARERAVAAIRTPAEWRERQREVRAALLDVLGPFPARTPLNVRITGTSRRDGYRLE